MTFVMPTPACQQHRLPMQPALSCAHSTYRLRSRYLPSLIYAITA